MEVVKRPEMVILRTKDFHIGASFISKNNNLWCQLIAQVATHLSNGYLHDFQSLRDNLRVTIPSRKNGYTKQTRKERKIRDTPLKKTSIQDRSKEAIKLSCKLENRPDNHVLVADFVKEFKNDIIRPPDSEVTNNMHIHICGLDGTVYSGENYRLESWEQCFLSKPTKMKVLGIMESSKGMALFPQWIVLVGKNGHVYGYKEEVLYLHANSLKYLVEDGIKKIKTYYDNSDDISDEEEEVLQNYKEVQRLRQMTDEFINKDADEFNDFYAKFIS